MIESALAGVTGWPGFLSSYPNGFLSLVTAPTDEPLTVAEMKKHLRLDTSDGEPAPTAPTVALAGTGAGNCDNGSWRVAVTFVTTDGETELGALSALVTVADKTTNGKIAVSDIPLGGSLVTARNVYAIAPSASLAFYVAQITNNTATTYTMNIAASSLGVQAPSTNTTLDPEIADLVTTARMWAEQDLERALPLQTVTLYLDRFPCGRDPIWLPRPPLGEVEEIQYYDGDGVLQTWDEDEYLVFTPAGPTAQRGQVIPASGVSYPLAPTTLSTPRRPDAVQVTYSCGYPTIPEIPNPIKAGLKLLGGALWINREAAALQPGVTAGVVLPFGVDALFAPYRVRVY